METRSYVRRPLDLTGGGRPKIFSSYVDEFGRPRGRSSRNFLSRSLDQMRVKWFVWPDIDQPLPSHIFRDYRGRTPGQVNNSPKDRDRGKVYHMDHWCHLHHYNHVCDIANCVFSNPPKSVFISVATLAIFLALASLAGTSGISWIWKYIYPQIVSGTLCNLPMPHHVWQQLGWRSS